MTGVIKTVPIELDANTRYVVRVRSINSFGVSSDWSEGLVITTTDDADAPGAPSNVSVSSYPRGIVARWTPVDDNDLSEYEINVTTGSGEFTPNVNTLVGVCAQSNTFIITKYWNGAAFVDLVPGNLYSVKIRAIDAAGNASAYSSYVSTTAGYVKTSDIQDSAITPIKLDREYLSAGGGTLTGTLGSGYDIYTTDGTNEVRLKPSGQIELTNASGPYIDFKNYLGDDYDSRIQYSVLSNGLVVTASRVTFSDDVEVQGDLVVNGMPFGVAALSVQPIQANRVGVVVQGFTGQSVALQQWADHNGSVLSYVSSTGVFTGPGTGLTLLDADKLSTGTVPTGRLSGTYNIDITGSVAVAGQLATPRSITLNGDATGSTNFDGSANVTLAVTIADDTDYDSHHHDGRYYTEAETDSLFVNVSGDTMSGPLMIAATPTSDSQVANKLYVDTVSDTISDSILGAEDPLPQYHNDYRGDIRYPSKDQLEALLGDLLFVGSYDASTYDFTINTYPKPVWAPSGSYNLIPNSSFEIDAYQAVSPGFGSATPYYENSTPHSPADQLADQWKVWIRGTDSSRTYTATAETDWAQNGTKSQKIQISGTVGNTNKTSFGTIDPIAILPSTSYTVSAYGKGSAASKGRLSIRWLTSGLVEISDSYTSYFSDSSFDRVSTSVTSPSNAAFCTIEFEIGGATPTVGDWIQVDAVQLEESSTVSDFYLKASEQYRHGMYWIVAGTGQVDFLDTDYSGRKDVVLDAPVVLLNGDWIISLDPNTGATPSDIALGVNDIIFQYIPYSTETFIQAAIDRHTELYTDPATPTTYTHPHPQYLRQTETDALYSLINHDHDDDLFELISAHTREYAISVNNIEIATPNDIGLVTLTTVSNHGFSILEGINVTGLGSPLDGSWNISAIPATNKITYTLATPAIYTPATPVSSGLISYDPHIIYLREAEAELLYSDIDHNHDNDYEVINAVANHASIEINPDAHPQYLKVSDALEDFAAIVHNHDEDYAAIDHTHINIDEVQATDNAVSSVIYIGSATPNNPSVGDFWFETFNLSLTPPPAALNFRVTTIGSTTAVVAWDPWATSAEVSSIELQRTTIAGNWSTPAPVTLTVSVSDSTKTDTGLSEKTEYKYRIRALNSQGAGSYAYITSMTTINAAPAAPTITGATPSTTSIILNWTNNTTDQRSSNTYEVFDGNTSIAYTTSTTYTFTGLTENTSHTLGVKVWDKGDLPSNNGTVNSLGSTTTTIVSTCTNAKPPDVTGLTVTDQNYNQIKADWSAVGGITDLAGYRIRLYKTSDMSLQQTVTTSNLTYTFTGLSYSTGYTVYVDAYDTGGLYSNTVASGADTTQASPDSTAPPAPTLENWLPFGNYGEMLLAITWNDDATSNPTYGTVQYRKNGGAWTYYMNAANVTGLGHEDYFNVVTGVAGDVIDLKVWTTDSLGNTNSGSPVTSSYTLIASPTYIAATATNYWNGSWNGNGTYRPVQGYYTDPALNAIGTWYYGTTPETTLKNSGRRIILGGRIYLSRNDWGTASYANAKIKLHADTSKPAGAPTLYGTQTTLSNTMSKPGSGTYYAWNDLPAGWAEGIVAGTYRGIACYTSTGATFMNFDSVGENGFSGYLEFTHWG